MQPNLYVSAKDVDALLSVFPAYKDLDESQRKILKKLASVQFSEGTEERFYFPVFGNDKNKIRCIKALRTLTGLGLKEAKDAIEQETRFSLLGYNLTKEKVLAVVLAESGAPYRIVVKFE